MGLELEVDSLKSRLATSLYFYFLTKILLELMNMIDIKKLLKDN